MEKSEISFHRRADGFVETPEGQIAVVMTSVTQVIGDVAIFKYRPSLTSTVGILLEWNVDQPVQTFPSEVAGLLIVRSHARIPTDEELEAITSTKEAETSADSSSGKASAPQNWKPKEAAKPAAAPATPAAKTAKTKETKDA